MNANVAGVDLNKNPRRITQSNGLGIRHGVSWSDPSIRRIGAVNDVTYSMNVLDCSAITRESALEMIESASKLTRKGGLSYHCILAVHALPVSRADFEKQGFKVLKWESSDGRFFLKLKKE